LPKGTFKGLAKVVAPLCFWMAAGWATYPYFIEKISIAMNESIDSGEIGSFSMIMVILCIISGVSLAIHGFTGTDADDDSIKALAKLQVLCPYCGTAMKAESGQCAVCQKIIPK